MRRCTSWMRRRCGWRMGDYALRPFTADDLPMMAQWLQTPAVREWWGDPVEEQIGRTAAHLHDKAMDQRIACCGAEDFGYLQSYTWSCWPGGAPHFHDQPDNSHAMDVLIGLPAMLGKGHGAAMVRLYAETLLADGAPAVIIDPHPKNLRAIDAYRRAGFRDIAMRVNGEGDPALVMRFDPAFIFR
jgi:aminoglycoside 6'-N-acetyltransferase